MSDARQPILTARGLSVSLAGKSVLSGIDLSLDAGQIAVLIGPNGGGKTTLLRALLGQVRSQGDINWEGRSLSRWGRAELARLVAYLPQSPTFEPGDRVIDVLRLGRLPHGGVLGLDSAADDAVIESVAADLSLTDLLTRRVETLSGGQRQRVFLGRALAQGPKVLLLDEPATYLDVQHQVELHRLLRRLSKERGLAVLMASHDLNLAAAEADTAVVLKDGRVLACGATADVMTADTLTAAFGTPMRNVDIDGKRYVVTVSPD